MTVHMVRVWASERGNRTVGDVREACEAWVASYDETLETERLSIIERPGTDTSDSPRHLTGYWRFVWGEDATALLGDLESALGPRTEWYRIRYHECDHDDPADARGGCAWGEARDSGTVPGGI